MRTLAIVPARAGSTRVAGKNLRLIGGRPLVIRALDAALASRRPVRVVVSSDDPGVLEAVAAVDASLALERPSSLATDTSPAIDYVRHAVSALESGGSVRFDAVAIVQPSSPFTTAADIDATIGLLDATGADSAVTIMQVEHALHPAKLKRMEGDRLLPLYEDEGGRMAAHELAPVYVRNGSVYVSSRATIDGGDLLGVDSRGHLMPPERSLDINTELDLQFADFLSSRSRE